MKQASHLILFIGCFILPLQGAEITSGSDEEVPRIHEIVRGLDSEAIIGDVYPHHHDRINAEIQEHFGENNFYILGATNRNSIVASGKKGNTKSLLFFDEQGRSTELPHNNRSALQVNISEHSQCCRSFPRVTALFDSGELIYFNRTGRTRQNPWNLQRVAQLGNPDQVKGIVPFMDDECLYYSNNNLVVLNQNGEEVWRCSSDHDNEGVTITDLTFTHPNLDRIALCTTQLKLIEWKQTSWWKFWESETGEQSERQLRQRPSDMYYRIDGELELEYNSDETYVD